MPATSELTAFQALNNAIWKMSKDPTRTINHRVMLLSIRALWELDFHASVLLSYLMNCQCAIITKNGKISPGQSRKTTAFYFALPPEHLQMEVGLSPGQQRKALGLLKEGRLIRCKNRKGRQVKLRCDRILKMLNEDWT